MRVNREFLESAPLPNGESQIGTEQPQQLTLEKGTPLNGESH
jgi:hypothetical protein